MTVFMTLSQSLSLSSTWSTWVKYLSMACMMMSVLLLAVCGLAAGFPGVIYVLARGLAAMALVSVVQLARKKVTVHSEMPLAPFLLFGALI